MNLSASNNKTLLVACVAAFYGLAATRGCVASFVRQQQRKNNKNNNDDDNNELCRLEFDARSGDLFVGDRYWMTMGNACFRHDGKEKCFGHVPLDNKEYSIRGKDPLGEFSESGSRVAAVATATAEAPVVLGKTTTTTAAQKHYSLSRLDDDDDNDGFHYNNNHNNNNSNINDTTTVLWEMTYRYYEADPSTIFFGQHFPNGLESTKSFPAPTAKEAASNFMASWFPSFRLPDNQTTTTRSRTTTASSSHHRRLRRSPPLGVLSLSGPMSGWNFEIKPWRYNTTVARDAFQSGPIALFSTECAVILSTASSFMSSSSMIRTGNGDDDDDSDDTGDGSGKHNVFEQLGFGVIGSIKEIPKGHRTSVILSSSPLDGRQPDGIRQAFSRWGAKLQTLYGTNRQNNDVTLDYLQYSTDNGAFYYYQTEPNKTYQDTILEVKDHSKKVGLPFRNWLMDSWWYYKGNKGGVTSWTARPDIFPDGIAYVRDETDWDIVAHNRWWSTETGYAKQNGGQYSFKIEEGGTMALPLEEKFWDDLFANSTVWGLTVYEQDWLYNQTLGMDYTLEDVEAARTWLVQMGNAAKRRGIALQYCMSYPRHILQSLEIDSVTQARASDDYKPNKDQWIPLGITSMFTSALGIAPLKDNFWSSNQVQPKRSSSTTTTKEAVAYEYDYESANRLQAIVATFSTGSVAPSDNYRFLNHTLLMRSCAQDGKILRPDVPAVRTDETILAEAGLLSSSRSSSSSPLGRQRNQVWSTMTDMSGFVYTYVLAAQSPGFVLTEKDLYKQSSPLLLHNTEEEENKFANGGSTKTNIQGHIVWELDAPGFRPSVLPHRIPATNKTTARVYCIAPIFENGWGFLGEAETKWTVVSNDRFSRLVVDSKGFSVFVVGAPGEVVQMMVRRPDGEFVRVDCVLSSFDGTAIFSSVRMGCSSSSDNNNNYKNAVVA